ncbi:YlxR family protein [Spiroplasma endosymbiont of Agriotes lineatus]|uniref:YlxR family protein n=1 Tax=Spiroplasma endosymbiont of Agriotes lineatus TaxID=3077930 RepID=UPI0030D5F1AC
MTKQKLVYRQCIVTKAVVLRSDLIRIVKTKQGQVFIDLNYRLAGKGAYVKREVVIIEKMQKKQLLKKIFKTQITDEIYLLLVKIVKEQDNNN